MDDANNMMLNMSRANRAIWQRGLPSLPTQFLQVTTKFLETATGLNGQFTRAERGRMLLGQLGLYGTAGVPVLGAGTMVLAEVFGMDQQTIEDNPEFVKAFNDGFWGITAYQVFGVDIELSSRGSLLRGIGDFVDNWFVQESAITEKLLGAFGSTQQNFVDSFMRELKPFTISNMNNIDFEDVGTLLTNPILDSISTWRNSDKAEFMYKMGELHNKRGRVVVRDNFDFMDALAQAIGFQRTEFAETYELAALNRAQSKRLGSVTDAILLQMNDFAVNHPNGEWSEEDFAKHEQAMALLYEPLDYDQQQQVRESVSRALLGDTRRDLEVSRAIENIKENTAAAMELWKATAIGNKVLRFGYETEEDE